MSNQLSGEQNLNNQHLHGACLGLIPNTSQSP